MYDVIGNRLNNAQTVRLIRGMGNLSARSRLRADLSERPEYVPRGLMVSTGEDLPPGQSILARSLVIEVDRDQLDMEALTRAQQQAHRLPHAMAGYLDWLTPQLDDLRAGLPAVWRGHRTHFSQQATHLRIPEILAYLALGRERDALTSLSLAASRGEPNAEILYRLAEAELRTGSTQEAFAHARQALQLHSNQGLHRYGIRPRRRSG